MRSVLIGLSLVACAGVGFWAGRTTAASGPSRRAEPPRRGAEAPAAAAERLPPVIAPPEKPTLRDLLDDEGGLLVEAEVARRAEALRARALRAAELAEHTERRQVDAEIARERALLEDAARGGTMALLRKLKSDWTPPWRLLSSHERFTAVFARRSEGGTIASDRVDRKSVLQDGDVLRFAPGRHDLDVHWLRGMTPFPKDLVIEGHGMDATLLVLRGDLDVRGEVHNLTFRDLTIHTNNNYLESIRHEPYTLRLERCRIGGFDMAAGSSAMLGGHTGVFYAIECRIEAGFGRHPGSGNLFDVRGAFVARLERCVIVGPFRSVYYRHSAAQLFVECRFEKMSPRIRSQLETAHKAVRFHKCTFDYLPDGARGERRDVTEINPAWAKR